MPCSFHSRLSSGEFFPTTFVLPADAEACHAAMRASTAQPSLWIVKPIASSRGRGISIIQQPHQLPAEDVVVSRYVANPLLIDGFKFDLRLYVAVTSFHPLRMYVYDEGLARFSTEPYQNAGGAALKNLFMHLTNYSINKHSQHFVPNNDADADDHGNKWSLSALRRCLARNGIDVDTLFKRIDALVVRTLISVEPAVTAACRRYMTHRSCAFELFGFDVLVDDQLKPWLLEVNLSPSLAVDSPLDLKVKTGMLSELLSLAAIRPYDREAHRVDQKRKGQLRYERLARGEPSTRPTFRARPADAALSSEALRAIAEMDEEAARAGSWRRLFPSVDGHAHRHLFGQERPLNTLLVDVLRKRHFDETNVSDKDLDAIAMAPPPGVNAYVPPPRDEASAPPPSHAAPPMPPPSSQSMLLPSSQSLKYAEQPTRAAPVAAAPAAPPPATLALSSERLAAFTYTDAGSHRPTLPASRPHSTRSTGVKTSPRLTGGMHTPGRGAYGTYPYKGMAVTPAALGTALMQTGPPPGPPLHGSASLPLKHEPPRLPRPASGGGAVGGQMRSPRHQLLPSSAGAATPSRNILPR